MKLMTFASPAAAGAIRIGAAEERIFNFTRALIEVRAVFAEMRCASAAEARHAELAGKSPTACRQVFDEFYSGN